MSSHKHDVESQGAKPRDHEHPRHHFLKTAHKDWRVVIAVVLMLAMIMVYVFSNDLSHWPGRRASQTVPAANAP